MKTTLTYRIATLGTVATLAFSHILSVIPSISAYAEGPDSPTSSSVIATKTETSTEEVSWDTDRTAYIAGKKTEWQNSIYVNAFTENWGNLFVADSNTNTYRYPVWTGTYFTGVSISEACGGSSNNAILIGDIEDIINSGQIAPECIIYNYEVRYREVNVTQPTSFTVSFDTGTVLPDDLKIVDQTVTPGDVIAEPTVRTGQSLSEILDYCESISSSACYNGYKLEGFYYESSFENRYNGNPITANTTLYANWVDEYEDQERITEISLTVTPPEAGIEVTINDEGDWDTQRPQPNITLPDGAKYQLWGDDSLNYAYWIKGPGQDEYTPFTGVIEKGGKYYVEVWLRINEGELAIFDRNFTLLVNGATTNYQVTEYDIDGIGFLIEVDIPNDTPASEESSNVSAPDSGAFTASSSVAPVTSGAAIISLLALTYIFIRGKSARH